MKIGLELECATTINANPLPPKVLEGNDGSLRYNSQLRSSSTESERKKDGQLSLTEYRFGPFTKLSELFATIQSIIEDRVAYVNESMGIHIHISFNAKEFEKYLKLCSWEFVMQFQKNYTSIFKDNIDKERVDNHYCRFYHDKDDFDHIMQLFSQKQRDARYRCVNFHSFTKYHTIEFRIFKSSKDLSFIRQCVDFVLRNIIDFCKQNKLDDVDMDISKDREIDDPEVIDLQIKGQDTSDEYEEIEGFVVRKAPLGISKEEWLKEMEQIMRHDWEI